MMRFNLLQRVNAARVNVSAPLLNSSAAATSCQAHRRFCTDVDVNVSGTKKRPRGATTGKLDAEQGPYFSKYYVNKIEVENYLKRHDIAFRHSGAHLIVRECPFCSPTMDKPDNQFKLYIKASTGVYMCHRCKAKGSWRGIQQAIGGVLGEDDLPFSSFGELKRGADTPSSDVPGFDAGEIETGSKPGPSRSSLKQCRKQLEGKYSYVKDMVMNERGLKGDVLEKYSVGAEKFSFRDPDTNNFSSHLCYMFPMFNSRRKLVRYKVRSVYTKSAMKLEPKGGDWGLFGFDTLPTGADEVVLTEGEFDAMAVYQATGRPAISLPNGASSLPLSVVKCLERFKKIYLWMDEDIPGQDGARQFSKKLGRRRCLSVRTDGKAKDANDALLKGLDLEAMIRSAKAVPHEGVATFRDLKAEIFNEIMNPQQLQGIQSKIIPRFNELLKGHRRGELSIFSGHTGTGKTTLLAQLSLDYCMQGIPTMWGSFEINNVRLAKMLLKQFYSFKTGRSAACLAQPKVFEEWADRFDELPMYFMRYYGSNPIERIVDAMEYGNYVHDISHVLLDNLQFMTSGQGAGRNFDRFEVMDNAVQQLRAFASQHNVHVSLVVHPRKENDDCAIQTASIFGSAKATQEADNVIILQRGKAGRILEIKKNRFDGSLGSLSLRFNKDLQIFEQSAGKPTTNADLPRAAGKIPVVGHDNLSDFKLFASTDRRESRW